MDYSITIAFVALSTLFVSTPGLAALPTKHSLRLGYHIWGESSQIKASDGRVEDVSVEFAGPTIGYEYTSQSPVGFFASAEMLLLSGQAKTNGATITYKEPLRSFATYHMSGGLRMYLSPAVDLGLGVGVQQKSVKLNGPPSSIVATYEVQALSTSRSFYKIQMRWQVSSEMLLSQEILIPFQYDTTTGWAISVGYIF